MLFLLFLLQAPSFINALEINYPRIPGAAPPQDFIGSPREEIVSLYVKYFFSLIVWISGLVALGVLIYGGFLYLTSSGKPEKLIAAKKTVLSVFLGLLLLFSSYLILDIINPQFFTPEIEAPKEVEIIQKEEVPDIEEEAVASSIDVELPFGRIIEGRIFETYFSKTTPPQEGEKPRMTRIKENANEVRDIAEKIKESSHELKELTKQCSCSHLTPDCDPCSSGRSCDCDPCESVRGTIEDTQENILKQIDLLKREQKKTLTEIKSLEIELGRLERVKRFISSCPEFLRQSYSFFVAVKDIYTSTGGIVREMPFWNNIVIPYLNKRNEQVTDWASFTCTIGGVTLETPVSDSEEEEEIEEKIIPEESVPCSAEVPVGEIIDRAQRTGRLLKERMKMLVKLNKEIISAADELNVLVSQCSSQVPMCVSICIPTKGGCIESCVSLLGPCPSSEIDEEIEIIDKIYERDPKEAAEGIKNVVENSEESVNKKEKIGILPIINSVVPGILSDLEKSRFHMASCHTKESEEALFSCSEAFYKTDPGGETIRVCCMEEEGYKACLNECYLKSGGEYKTCLKSCLKRKSEEAKRAGIAKAEEISLCRHSLNFYCCQ